LQKAKELSENKLCQKGPYGAGKRHKNVSHAQENEDYFRGKDDGCEQQKIGKQENNAASHAFMAFIEEKKATEVQKKPGHCNSGMFIV
jgi:hypothetical protein